ncbi:hypothetical protein D0Y50_13255 [Salinimonas sediminis]|uniref:Uncharacterized protein n=1 Tax=Salinimonas sediminis TaxID=2303538 RepID=A0A346NNX3_9ALTE|nr:hypothetical protein D0Y50_13255 [Salinimonas sediminis]
MALYTAGIGQQPQVKRLKPANKDRYGGYTHASVVAIEPGSVSYHAGFITGYAPRITPSGYRGYTYTGNSRGYCCPGDSLGG